MIMVDSKETCMLLKVVNLVSPEPNVDVNYYTFNSVFLECLSKPCTPPPSHLKKGLMNHAPAVRNGFSFLLIIFLVVLRAIVFLIHHGGYDADVT